jgi:predicted nucleic acid-binding protein
MKSSPRRGPVDVIRIVNASPLIALAKAGLHDLLSPPGDTIRILHAVASEIDAGPQNDPARVLLSSHLGQLLPPIPIPGVVLEWGLGAGESSVLAEAIRTPGAEAVLDDAAARRCARGLGVAVTGTLGVVVRARQAGRITAVAPALMALRDAGLFFSDELAEVILARLGEEWPAR